jgi:hypothetical protein
MVEGGELMEGQQRRGVETRREEMKLAIGGVLAIFHGSPLKNRGDDETI